MINKLFKPLLVAHLTLALSTHITLANASETETNTHVNLDGRAVTADCRSGDFQGWVELSAFRHDNIVGYTVDKYKILYSGKSDHDILGHSANINAFISSQSSQTAHSPDAMKQDNNWRQLGLTGLAVANAQGKITGNVQFVFDRSNGSDPKCTIYIL